MMTQLESLPDEILVKIGFAVAKICGLQDFLSLTRTSTHLRDVLWKLKDDETREQRAMRIRNHAIPRPTGSRAAMVGNLKNLQQVHIVESLVKHNVMENNTILYLDDIGYSHLRYNEYKRTYPYPNRILETLNNVANAMEELIPRHPNLKFIIETHIGNSQRHRWQATPQRSRSFLYDLVRRLERVMYGLEHHCEWNTLHARFQLRFWGKKVTSLEESNDPRARNRGWFDIFFVLESDNGDELETLELPPRPEYYNGLTPESTAAEVVQELRIITPPAPPRTLQGA